MALTDAEKDEARSFITEASLWLREDEGRLGLQQFADRVLEGNTLQEKREQGEALARRWNGTPSGIMCSLNRGWLPATEELKTKCRGDVEGIMDDFGKVDDCVECLPLTFERYRGENRRVSIFGR